jgi:hypothetical protein
MLPNDRLGSKAASLEVSRCFPVCLRKRTSDLRVNEYTPFCNGPVDVNCSPIVTPPSTVPATGLRAVGASVRPACVSYSSLIKPALRSASPRPTGKLCRQSICGAGLLRSCEPRRPSPALNLAAWRRNDTTSAFCGSARLRLPCPPHAIAHQPSLTAERAHRSAAGRLQLGNVDDQQAPYGRCYRRLRRLRLHG